MYYVYYIKGIKVGCTKDLKKRVEEEQGHKNYKILFESTDIKKASNAERYWQEKLGYPKDQMPYEELINKNNNNNLKTKKMIKKTNHTITFKVNPKEITKDFLLNLMSFQDVNGVNIDIDENLADWILKNLKKSQFNNEMFVYNQSLINAYEYLLKNENKSIFDNIRHWAEKRGIYKKGDSKTQYVKLQEEAGELAKALLKRDEPEIIDAIGDIVVVLTNLAHLEGYKIEDCISSAYNVIKSRHGEMVNGTFVKNK